MNNTLVENWNDVVGKDDIVYHLGDVFYKIRSDDALKILHQLNGKIYVISGNHDKTLFEMKNMLGFYDKVGWIKDYYELRVNDNNVPGNIQHIVLFHYALRVWNRSHWGAWGCVGHSHSTLPEANHNNSSGGLLLDVGVDSAANYFTSQEVSINAWNLIKLNPKNYRPFSYEEVKDIMLTKKKYTPDQHKGEIKDVDQN
jgi:calcineurin-like phosphoesterase family protein